MRSARTELRTHLIALLAILIAVVGGESNLRASPLDIHETSPDGKWLFEATPYQDRGYLWDLKNLATGKAYFVEPPPSDNEILPRRLNVLWSPSCRYAAINVYYGRLVYGINVISLTGDVPRQADWSYAKEVSMIKPQDKKAWNGSGEVNPAAHDWRPADILEIALDMRAQLTDKTSGKLVEIDSSRTQSIQFSGTKGRILDEQPPCYDEPAP